MSRAVENQTTINDLDDGGGEVEEEEVVEGVATLEEELEGYVGGKDRSGRGCADDGGGKIKGWGGRIWV